jgi:hypothetical protein
MMASRNKISLGFFGFFKISSTRERNKMSRRNTKSEKNVLNSFFRKNAAVKPLKIEGKQRAKQPKSIRGRWGEIIR